MTWNSIGSIISADQLQDWVEIALFEEEASVIESDWTIGCGEIKENGWTRYCHFPSHVDFRLNTSTSQL
jgi:hypothetical protein